MSVIRFFYKNTTSALLTFIVSFFSLYPNLSYSQFAYNVYDGDFNQLPNFSLLTPIASGRSDTISLNVTSQKETFALVFTHQLSVNTAGNYNFSVTSDDGSRLYIDNQLVINNDGLHGPVTRRGNIFLNPGRYNFRLEFFEKSGGETLNVSYRFNNGSDAPIPKNGILQQINQSSLGQWGGVIQWPEIAISAANLPDGRVLTWSSTETNGFPSNREFSHASLFNPENQTFQEVNNNFHDMFCAGISMLEDGSVIAAGGNPSDRRTSKFNTEQLRWSSLNTMIDPRWYATTVTLPENNIFTSFGKDAGNRSELYNSTIDAWFPLSNVSMQTLQNEQNAIQNSSNPSGALSQEWFAHLAVTPQGHVLQAGPTQTWHIFDPADNLPNTSLGRPIGDTARMYGNAVSYDLGKVLLVGGGDRRKNNPTSVNNVYLIDLNGVTPIIEPGAPMNYPRALSNTVTLPNGEVLVIGGNTVAKIFSDEGSVFPAEIYTPETNSWRIVDSIDVPRNYHSTALLLKDARVLSAGGGACGNGCAANHADGQIFTPPYLFNDDGSPATRPLINNAPEQASAGEQITVAASADTVKFSMVRLSGTTHHMNTDQRFIPVEASNNGNGSFTIELPTNPNVLIMGYYWIYALNAQGTPSIGQALQIVRAPANEDIDVAAGFRYYRFTPTTLRSNAADSVQLAEFALLEQGTRLFGAAVNNPGGRNPANERPSQANDGNTSSKWLDFNKGALIYDFGQRVQADSYYFVTANDIPARDPVRWVLEASVDGMGWLVLDDQRGQNYPTPVERFRTTQTFTFTPDEPEVEEPDIEDPVDPEPPIQPEEPPVVEPQPEDIIALPQQPRHSSTLVVESTDNGERVWNVNPDNNTVSVSQGDSLLAEIAVGFNPWSLALSQSQRKILVTNKLSASISVINTESLTLERTITLQPFSEPHGIVINADSTRYYVVLENLAAIEERRFDNDELIKRLNLSGRPRHISMSYDDTTLLVSNFITPRIPGESTAQVDVDAGAAEVFAINTLDFNLQETIQLRHDNRSPSESQGPGMPNYLGPSVLSFDNQYAYVPSKKDNINSGSLRQNIGMTFDLSVRANTSRILLNGLEEDANFTPIDHDNSSVATGAALSGDNRYLFVALETSRELAVYDTQNGFQLMRLPTGKAPQSVALSNDSRTAYVHNYMDRSISRFDLTDMLLQNLPITNTLPSVSVVTQERLAAEILRGKQLFYDAADDRLARDNYMSCASCHKDEGHDGRVWDFTHTGEGLRNTISLKGKSAMQQGALHWSANFDEIQDFEAQIRQFSGGLGLMSDADFQAGTRSEPLGDKKSGISPDLDALAAFLNSLNVADISPFTAANGLSADAIAGKKLFNTKGCRACHAGVHFTDSSADVQHDIGTIKSSSGKRLSDVLKGIDTPTLRGLWHSAPYLHDGSAASVAEAITAHTELSFNPDELKKLEAYLFALDESEDNTPPNDADGDGIPDEDDAFPNDPLNNPVIIDNPEPPAPENPDPAPPADDPNAPNPAEPEDEESQLWVPSVGLRWQYQLDGDIDSSLDVEAFVIDLTYPDSSVDTLSAEDKKAVCLFSAGTNENFRLDTNAFPEVVQAELFDNFSSERILDIRNIELLAPIMQARLDECQDKGFAGVALDKIDLFQHESIANQQAFLGTSFNITEQDTIRYIQWFASEAKKRNLAIGIKNSVAILDQVLSQIDFVITDSCFTSGWCAAAAPVTELEKPVLMVEFMENEIDFEAMCKAAKAYKFSAILRDYALNSENFQACDNDDAKWWQPEAGTTWQYQLDGTINPNYNVDAYDIDLTYSAATVTELKARDKKTICYFSVATNETFRPDTALIPNDIQGELYDEFSDERVLDIRNIDKLAPIMKQRLDECLAKGFDGVELDKVGIFNHETSPNGLPLLGTSFNIQKSDSIRYVKWFAKEAHQRGLAIGLKNTPEILADVIDDIDFMVADSCFFGGWCADAVRPIQAKKPVFMVEYTSNSVDFNAMCNTAKNYGFSAILRDNSLQDNTFKPCL